MKWQVEKFQPIELQREIARIRREVGAKYNEKIAIELSNADPREIASMLSIPEKRVFLDMADQKDRAGLNSAFGAMFDNLDQINRLLKGKIPAKGVLLSLALGGNYSVLFNKNFGQSKANLSLVADNCSFDFYRERGRQGSYRVCINDKKLGELGYCFDYNSQNHSRDEIPDYDGFLDLEFLEGEDLRNKLLKLNDEIQSWGRKVDLASRDFVSKEYEIIEETDPIFFQRMLNQVLPQTFTLSNIPTTKSSGETVSVEFDLNLDYSIETMKILDDASRFEPGTVTAETLV